MMRQWYFCLDKMWIMVALVVSIVAGSAQAEEVYSFELDDPADYNVSDAETIEFANGTAKLTVQLPVGDGADGALTVSEETDISDTGKAPSWSVTGFEEGEGGRTVALIANPANTDGLAVGDEVLLIQLQGSLSYYAEVGTYEFFTVYGINSQAVTLNRTKTNFYGRDGGDDGLGISSSSHKVMLLRIPHFSEVTIADGGVLTASAWDGTKGGVLAFRVAGALTVEGSGRVDMSTRGYRGGLDGRSNNEYGQCGEGVTGVGTQPPNSEIVGSAYITYADEGSNGGAGGPGISHGGTGGGGGSYGTQGTPGYAGDRVTWPNDRAYPGAVVGDDQLTRLFLGGGGGGGGDADDGNPHADGAAGGGVIYIAAASVNGLVAKSKGGAGSIGNNGTSCGYGIGGSGAGGTIYLIAGEINGLTFDATGGPVQTYQGCADCCGGVNQGAGGGDGRIRIDANLVNGDAVGTGSAVTVLEAACAPDPGTISAVASAYATSAPYMSNVNSFIPSAFQSWASFATKTGAGHQGRVGFQVADDEGQSWSWWNGNSWVQTSTTDGSEVNTASEVNAHIAALEGSEFSFRAFLISDGSQQVVLDEVSVGYDIDPVYLDGDEDGVTPANGDCDDTNPEIHPGVDEVCNGIDDNCDGAVDEGVIVAWSPDRDGDGYGDSSAAIESCSRPAPLYVDQGGDCDDFEETIHPEADEVCDDVDQNCDGQADEDLPQYTYCLDADGDGHGNDAEQVTSCLDSPPEGRSTLCDDCNDQDESAYPGAPELCDGEDQDCDGVADNDIATVLYYLDSDGDGHGDPATTIESCEESPDGYSAFGDDCDDTNGSVYPGAEEIPYDGIDQDCDTVDPTDVDQDGYLGTGASGDDCDDTNPAINPGASESCNGIDDNCDGSIDEGASILWSPDRDSDGYGDLESAIESCTRPAPLYVSVGGDCNDLDPSINPEALEVCDGIDQDCDGEVDEELSQNTYCVDADEDGHGDPAQQNTSCADVPPKGSSTLCDDCDDADGQVYPGAPELCDEKDQDCDGVADNDVTSVTYYLDLDGDGHGDAETTLETCEQLPEGYALLGDDCNDNDNTIFPGANEVPYDTIDQDCQDGDLVDVDEDGFPGEQAEGTVEGPFDCNDEDPSSYPGAVEIVYDGIDQDCDGVDRDDLDSDGYRAEEAEGDDCLDTDPAVYPGAEEICENGIDEDCDGEDLSPCPTLEPSPTPEGSPTPEVSPTPTPDESPAPDSPTPTPDVDNPPDNTPPVADTSPTPAGYEGSEGCNCSTREGSPRGTGAIASLAMTLGLLVVRRRKTSTRKRR